MTNAVVELLIEQRLLANRMENDVEAILTKENLNVKQASKLYEIVAEAEGAFRRTIQELSCEEEINDELRELVANLETLWNVLSVACANKLRELQGLEPVTITTSGTLNHTE